MLLEAHETLKDISDVSETQKRLYKQYFDAKLGRLLNDGEEPDDQDDDFIAVDSHGNLDADLFTMARSCAMKPADGARLSHIKAPQCRQGVKGKTYAQNGADHVR